jgi:hypothetical protein
MAIADHYYAEDTADSLKAAIRLEGGNADYHALLAEHEEGNGHSPQPQLKEAIELSPLTSRYLIRAALRAEVDQDFSAAEDLLTRASKVDRKFAPRWALFNFYFRRGSDTGVWPTGFWSSMNSALEISSPEDSAAVFRLAWDRTSDPQEIRAHLSGSTKVQKQYLLFLMDTGRLIPAGEVATNLSTRLDESDVPLLVRYCDRASREDTKAAIAVRNTLISRRLVSGTPLQPENGFILTNPNFAPANPRTAFDWRIPSIDGILVNQAEDGHGIAVSFSGEEPEDCMILSQLMPVITGREFEIQYRYSSSGTVVRGLRWEVSGASGMLAASPELATETDGAQGQVAFKADGPWARLVLHYQRPLGTMRAEATIVIRGLTGRIRNESAAAGSHLPK